jgi:hypothetical protein
LQISTEANERSSCERKPAKINELRAKNKECAQFLAEFSPKLVEMFPNWRNFTQIGAQKPVVGRIGRNSVKFVGGN